jgi:hypothetical protein
LIPDRAGFFDLPLKVSLRRTIRKAWGNFPTTEANSMKKKAKEMTLLEMCDELAKGWALDERAEEIISEVRRRKALRQYDPIFETEIDERTDAMEARR